MAYNEHRCHIPYPESIVDDGQAIGMDVVRTLLQNALVSCESGGQVLAKFIAPSSADYKGLEGTITTGEWGRIFGTKVDVRLRPGVGGGAFRFRVRLAGAATGAKDVTFRIFIGHPHEVSASIAATATEAWVAAYTTSATNHAWLTEDGGKTLLTVPADRVASRIINQSTVDAIGGRRTTVPVCRLALEFWAKTTDAASAEPKLSGVLVEEYLGIS